MNWDGLDRVEDIHALTDDDATVLREIRDVLARHGALQRFGVTLLHSHFDLDEDEVLVERVNPTMRTLSTSPERVSDDERGRLVPTSWRLDLEGGTPVPLQFCWRPPDSMFHAT